MAVVAAYVSASYESASYERRTGLVGGGGPAEVPAAHLSPEEGMETPGPEQRERVLSVPVLQSTEPLSGEHDERDISPVGRFIRQTIEN